MRPSPPRRRRSPACCTPTERPAMPRRSAARIADAPVELGAALNWRASALVELGQPAKALELFRAALDVREVHAPAEVPFTQANVAISLSALGRFAEAADAAGTAIAAAERGAS